MAKFLKIGFRLSNLYIRGIPGIATTVILTWILTLILILLILILRISSTIETTPKIPIFIDLEGKKGKKEKRKSSVE